ncbi:FAD-binding oxidoreductase [Actinomycetospora endophytica]|uniref:FAD-binding oxidoreductase n=1 Tax=Actinomycetospora endophytica TaxID=2291215 RepID=A0ABS8P6C7_9PSEU|nr:FAD-binding oxidoreductase [Actinomycetospora endophytica]MCD2192956.1 FAD-binding oxidoreductase [Actinomycetospora endophytica]
MTVTAIRPDGSREQLGAAVLEDLRAHLRGPVTAPDGADATTEPRVAWNAMHTERPSISTRCTGTADVVDAVGFAREHGLLVGVRGGGHSVAGLSSVADGMLIDLSLMRGVQVDPHRRLAHVQGGALLGDIDRETQAFGLATPLGRVSETGVAGLTLGGGYGHLDTRYGLACDNLVEAQVVLADGRVVTASAEQNPDLFWALRGGGGNFGIVTSFTFRLHPVGPMVAFAGVFYPLEELGRIERGWRSYVLEAPREVTSFIVTTTFPADPDMPDVIHDRPVAIVGAVHCGDVDAGMATLQPLRELGAPLFDMSQPMPYTAVQSAFDPFFPRQTLRAYWKSQYLDELTDDAIDAIAARAANRPSPRSLTNTFHFGGAVHDLGPEETAFAERSAPFMVSFDSMWTDPADDASAIAWTRSAWQEMTRYGNGMPFLNFTGLDDEPLDANVASAFGRNLRRLGKVKAEYDPENFFRLNNNVRPSP